MIFDPHPNLLEITITDTPSSPTTQTSLKISNADRTALLAAVSSLATTPLNGTLGPQYSRTPSNSEIVRVTAVGAADSGGSGKATLTIVRNTETGGQTGHSVAAGDVIKFTETAKTLTDIENNLSPVRLPGTDHTAYGTKIAAVAKEDQAIGDAVQVGTDGKFHLAKADAIANASAIALVADATIVTDGVGNYLITGTIRDDTWNWTIGGLIYLSATGTTGNTLTQVAPTGSNSVRQILGVATAADEILFIPQLMQGEYS